MVVRRTRQAHTRLRLRLRCRAVSEKLPHPAISLQPLRCSCHGCSYQHAAVLCPAASTLPPLNAQQAATYLFGGSRLVDFGTLKVQIEQQGLQLCSDCPCGYPVANQQHVAPLPACHCPLRKFEQCWSMHWKQAGGLGKQQGRSAGQHWQRAGQLAG